MESPNQSLGPIKKLQSILHSEVGPGILLVIMAVLAMTIMNSPLASYYEDIFRTKVVFGVGPIVIDKPFLLWVNDGLMAIFFFLIGLEIKRELMVGHLSDIRQALLPLHPPHRLVQQKTRARPTQITKQKKHPYRLSPIQSNPIRNTKQTTSTSSSIHQTPRSSTRQPLAETSESRSSRT